MLIQKKIFYKKDCKKILSLLNEDFEGGDLIVYDNKKNYLKKTTGNSYIFESSLEHKVTKITSGIRYVLVAHLRSKEVQKKLI